MVLTGLFLLITITIFLNVEPFRTIGVFLNICYLPGLGLLALGKRERLSYEDLLLSFPCSVGISVLLTLMLLFTGVHIKNITFIIYIINGFAVVFFLIAHRKKKIYPIVELNKQEVLFSFFALLAILLLSVPFLTGPNRMAISAHAFHHSLLIAQIMNGIFPPENPGLGGTIIGYYWGFHALIAALTVKTNFQQIQIIFLLNVISLYVIFCISYSVAKAFNLSEPYRYIMPLAIMGIMRVDAGVLFLVKLFSGSLMPLETLTASPVEPYEVLDPWIQGLSWIDTRLFFLHKLYNVSGMLLALSLCYAYLLILVKSEFYSNKTYIFSIALIISGCFFYYPPLAVFLLFHVPLWFFYIFLSSYGNLKEKIRQASKILIPYIAAGLVVSPYMFYVMVSRNISSGGQGEIFSFDFYDQSLKNMVVFMVPLPMILYGFWIVFKRFSFSKEFYFLALGTILCIILTVFTRWPFNNSYKFNYILIFFFSLFFVFALASLFTYVNRKWLKQVYAAVIILLLSLTPIIVESSHIVSSFSTEYVFSFAGRHIAFAQDKQKNEAYQWIRENTPYNSLVMLTYTETNWPCCGFNNNYIPAAIAERTLYVIRDDDYTVSNPEYAKRILFREKLFNNPDNRTVIDYFSEINRPIYLLIEENLDESRFFVEDRFKQFPENIGKPFKLVFSNDMQRVYQLNVKE